jgi:serine/threonine-protein kinase
MGPSDSGSGQIGRYLLAGRLGSGGMGEVFLAWDEQLKRRVAIKRIHPDAGLSFKQRERFFCEAQHTASVSHPNVVQIYDLLVEDEAIVMEYIEGRTLAERLAAERLETAQVLRLALEIARGLAAAHEAKLVHRDLKAANVLITRSEEHAKIVDFGLARPFVRVPGDPGLTRQGMVMGTPHAMSPEQIRGEVVDERSDLFSFGSLFHEMLTGRPPFRGSDEFDSQWKVLHEEPVHPQTARMDLPAEATDLLLRLLEKDRDDRPGSAQEVIEVLQGLQIAPSAARPAAAERSAGDHPSSEETVLDLPARPHRDRASAASAADQRFRTRRRLLVAGAAVLLLLAVAAARLWPRPARPLRVAVIVMPHAEDPDLDRAASEIRSVTLGALRSLEKITPVDPEEVARVGGPPAQIGRAVSADQVLTISVERKGDTALVTLDWIAVRSGDSLRSSQLSVSLGQGNRPALADSVAPKVQKPYPNGVLSNLDEMSKADRATFLEIQERVDDGQASRKDLARLEKIMSTNPECVEVPLLAARIALSQFQTRREPDDLGHASKLAQRAQELAPKEIRPLRLELQIALTRHDLKDAETILEQLEQLDPGDPVTLPLRAELAEQQGHLDKASEALFKAVEQAPSWQNRYLLAGVEARLGRIHPARKQIEIILAQSPGNVWALEKSGDLEMSYGDPGNAETIYRSLLDSPARERALSNLGTLRVLGEHFEEAAKIYRRVLAEHKNHVNALINLAEVETELKEKGSSALHYRLALEQLNKNEAKAGLLPGEALLKAQCLARLGQAPEALAIVTALSPKAKDDPQLLYQSALVLSLAGEQRSAVTEAKAALTKGFLPRWFTGSDFRWLRDDPELRQWFPKTS